MHRLILVGLIASLLPALALAQGATVPFGGLKMDNTLPVEISADSLSIDQAAAKAEFLGNVKVGQGTLHLTSDKVLVTYLALEDGSTGQIDRIEAEGHVTLSNGAEAAEAAKAVYLVATGEVTMSGDVLLTQGKNALSGDSLRINLQAGTAVIEGRVKTIFQPDTQQ